MELKIDTDGDAVGRIAYGVRFSSSENGAQTETLRHLEAQAGGQATVGRPPEVLSYDPKRSASFRDGGRTLTDDDVDGKNERSLIEPTLIPKRPITFSDPDGLNK